MIGKHAVFALGTFGLVAGCATDQRAVPADPTVEKQGVWVSGEYAYLRASDGGVFVLLVPNSRDQRRFAMLAPIKVDATETCLALQVQGSVNGKSDATNRPFFVVSKIIAARRVEC